MDKHKYSTVVLVGLIAVTVIAFAIGLDGGGTKNSLAKFYSPERVVNSQLFDDGENLTYNGTVLCSGGTCVSGSPSTATSNNTLIYKNECLDVACNTHLEVAWNE